MSAIQLKNGSHTRSLLVSFAPEDGWEILEEHDSRVVRRVRCHDWHRVERAKQAFGLRASDLRRQGWREVES